MNGNILCVAGIEDTVSFIELLLKNGYEVKATPVDLIGQDGRYDGFKINYSNIVYDIKED